MKINKTSLNRFGDLYLKRNHTYPYGYLLIYKIDDRTFDIMFRDLKYLQHAYTKLDNYLKSTELRPIDISFNSFLDSHKTR